MIHILVVDDDEKLNKIVCKWLNDGGFEAKGVLDADAMTAEIDGEEIPVATRAFNILYKLLSYPKKTFTNAIKYNPGR